MATLFIFAGLPGTGKSTLAQRLAHCLKATYLRIDTMEQGLRDVCGVAVQSEGYLMSYRIAADNLRLDIHVVADSCNPIELTRLEWQQVAEVTSSTFVNIEVICSDAQEHKRRVETRSANASDQSFPTWEEVLSREYDHLWSADRVVIDTAGQTVEQSIAALLSALAVRINALKSA